MSKFNNYARKLDDIAKAAFTAYGAATARLEKAERQAKEYPPRNGMTDAQYMAKSARAQAELLEAKNAVKAAQDNYERYAAEIKEVRKELAAAVEDAYSVDPKKLDTATLELLKSGILNPTEYGRLMSEAQAADNPTMVRLIGKYADDASNARGAQYGQNDEGARTLRAVAYESRRSTGENYIGTFDAITDVYNRCTRNPALISSWDSLTAEAVENF